MAFKIPEKHPICPDDPESLFRDLRKKTVPGLLSHQADLLRSYLAVHTEHSDIALQLPTGSGKTLVGLLIAEWRRRKYGERVVYLCPTRQLVNQVAEQATGKYGIDVRAFTGSRANYDVQASSEWMNAEAVAITTYSSLFNTNPFFDEPNLIILDDAHSAENYVSSFWSLLIERSQNAAAFAALAGVVTPLLPASDRSRMAASSDTADQQWVEKLPTPVFQSVVPEIVALLDEHTQGNKLRYRGAIPSLKRVRYWSREDFRAWAKTALQVVREIRRDFPGPGNLGWRATVATRFKEAKIAPIEIERMLSKSAADAVTVVAGGEEG